jgi:hypothetical protein
LVSVVDSDLFCQRLQIDLAVSTALRRLPSACFLIRDLSLFLFPVRVLPRWTHGYLQSAFDRDFVCLYFPFASIVRYATSSAQEGRAERRLWPMRSQPEAKGKTVMALIALAFVVIGQFLWAQNLGSAPASNVAVQGETGAQPEGAFLNFINWIGNVIAPVGAGGAVLGAVVSWLTGRGFGRWLFAAAALLAISGVTRLIEFWITNGTAGVT